MTSQSRNSELRNDPENVEHIQEYAVVKQKLNSIHILCENFRTIPWVLCKNSVFNLKGLKSKVSKLKSVFQ